MVSPEYKADTKATTTNPQNIRREKGKTVLALVNLRDMKLVKPTTIADTNKVNMTLSKPRVAQSFGTKNKGNKRNSPKTRYWGTFVNRQLLNQALLAVCQTHDQTQVSTLE